MKNEVLAEVGIPLHQHLTRLLSYLLTDLGPFERCGGLVNYVIHQQGERCPSRLVNTLACVAAVLYISCDLVDEACKT